MQNFAQLYMDELNRERDEFRDVMRECKDNPKRLRREALFYMQTMKDWLQAKLSEASQENV